MPSTWRLRQKPTKKIVPQKIQCLRAIKAMLLRIIKSHIIECSFAKILPKVMNNPLCRIPVAVGLNRLSMKTVGLIIEVFLLNSWFEDFIDRFLRGTKSLPFSKHNSCYSQTFGCSYSLIINIVLRVPVDRHSFL